jgi:parvulin-like peptidyl-prolyl isomerase
LERSEAEAQKLADEILGSISKKKLDREDALKNSDDLQSDGYLGYFSHDFMPKPICDATYKLKINEISTVIKTEYGFFLLQRLQ